jgi:hypothetical protein
MRDTTRWTGRQGKNRVHLLCVWCSWSPIFEREFSQILEMSKTENEEKYYFLTQTIKGTRQATGLLMSKISCHEI